MRQLYAEGKVDRAALLEAEAQSYHGPGTCTFYGTANSNQMLIEIMGLHLPGSTFVNPGTALREELTRAATKQALSLTALGNAYTPIGRIYDEKAVVNGVVGLLATGGSTNHTMHLIVMAAAAGITLTWDDLAELSHVVPLLARVYPNGKSDVNHFHAAGGMGLLMRELLDAGLLHEDVMTIMGHGLRTYLAEPVLNAGGQLVWRDAAAATGDDTVLRGVTAPFQATGGSNVLSGNLGTGVIKSSSIPADRHVIEAPARVFHSQEALQTAFKAGELNRDVVAVVRFQGPEGLRHAGAAPAHAAAGRAAGQGVSCGAGDGRPHVRRVCKVPAAIHMTPEAADGGPIAKLRDGDMIRLDADAGTIEVLTPSHEFAAREPVAADLSAHHWGTGRELFAAFRTLTAGAAQGASLFGSH